MTEYAASPARALPPIAMTMGEPAGIGPEVILKSWAARNGEGLSPFYVIAPATVLADRARFLGLDIPIVEIHDPVEARDVFAKALPVFPLAQDGDVTIGTASLETAQSVVDSIRQAVAHTKAGKASAVVTSPIQKFVLYETGFTHPGHTEFLAELCGAPQPVMMLAVPGLRVVPLTVHIPIAQVSDRLTRELIVETGRIVAAALKRDFALDTPRLAVAGLNPHAGENGTLGAEDLMTITPAIEQLRAEGIEVSGPHPADSMFHERARSRFDAALCAYHDQALIPLKTIDFDRGVNITLGLPIVRTSPDHGTALDIASRGIANPSSMIEAIKTAAVMAESRARHS